MEEPTAKELEFQFRIKCEKYYDLQSQGETSTGEYKFIGDELLRKFQLLKNVADDEHYFWDFCNFDTYKEKIKVEKHDLKRANRSSINNDKEFYRKKLRDLERKTSKAENHDNLILKSENYIPFNYFIQTGRLLVALDFLEAQTERNIAVVERRKIEFINEKLLEAEKNDPRQKKINEEAHQDFLKEYGKIFKNEESLELFNFIDENFDERPPTKYSSIYRLLKSNKYDNHIVCTGDKFREFIKKSRGFEFSTILRLKTYKYKDSTEKRIDTIVKKFYSDLDNF